MNDIQDTAEERDFQVIDGGKELEDTCNYSSVQAAKIINSLPQSIIETLSYDTAKQVKDIFSEIGAYVTLKIEKCNILIEVEADSPQYQYYGIKVLNTENATQTAKNLLINARQLNQSITHIEYKDIIASGLPLSKAESFVKCLKKGNILCAIFKDTFNELKDKYNFSKEHDDKGKDDFEIEI